MFKKLIGGVLLASLALTAIAPAASAGVESRGTVKSDKDGVTRLVKFSERNGDRLSTLITAATCEYFGGAVTDLVANEKLTLFAPTNKAFRDLGQALGLGNAGINSSNVCDVDKVLGVEGALFTILGYHVTTPKIWYWQAKAARGSKIEMFTGEKAKLKGVQRDIVRIDGAKVVVKNILSKNAQIHVINKVMIPPSIEKVLAG
jgi:uncharacterized surface protein with fasciclin (FAS1) repeats